MSSRFPLPGHDQHHDWAGIAAALTRYARALTGNIHEAEDLSQQTLATLLAKRPDVADHLGFARTTLTRLWLDRQRAHRRLWQRFRRVAKGEEYSADAGGEDSHPKIHEAIADLPPKQRAVLVLKVVEGLGYEAIARTLGCDVGAVRTNLHVARTKLRSTLEGLP